MAFIYDEATRTAYDAEKDIRLKKHEGAFIDRMDTDLMSYTIEHAGKIFNFDILIIFVPYQPGYKSSYAKDYVPSEENNAKAPSSTIFILEDSFKEGFYTKDNARAFVPTNPANVGIEAVLQSITHTAFAKTSHEKMKLWFQDGFFTLMTEGGARLERVPGEKYLISFEKNIATAAQKHPGKFPHYERWACAYGKMPNPD